MQVPPGPQAEPEGLGQGHTVPFPRGPLVHSPPRAREQACSPLQRTQAALPTPTRLRLERGWDHTGITSPPWIEGGRPERELWP